MDDKKHPTQSETQRENAKVNPTAAQTPVPVKGTRRIFSKRWLYPAIYLGAAALIIGLMYVKSQMGSRPASSTNVTEPPSTPTTTQSETFSWPVTKGTSYTVTMGFFPVHGTVQQQAATLVHYQNEYAPHEGVDIKSTSGSPFEVVAATSGTVTKVQNNQLMGKTVEITADKTGYVESYQSLSSTAVQPGQIVQQGAVLGQSGTSLYEQGQGNHLYFAVQKDGQPVDPQSVLPAQ